jgi:hypothetical protein
MTHRGKTFVVPSLEDNHNKSAQHIVTIILLVLIFSFGLALSSREIHELCTKLWAVMHYIIGIVVDLFFSVY